MKVDVFNNGRDYETVKSWWLAYEMTPIEPKFLGQGFIIQDQAAIFVYPTGTPNAFIENLITNKSLSKDDRDAAIDLLVKTVVDLLRLKGVEIVTAVTKMDVVVKRALEKHGFITNDGKYKILTKKLS